MENMQQSYILALDLLIVRPMNTIYNHIRGLHMGMWLNYNAPILSPGTSRLMMHEGHKV